MLVLLGKQLVPYGKSTGLYGSFPSGHLFSQSHFPPQLLASPPLRPSGALFLFTLPPPLPSNPSSQLFSFSPAPSLPSLPPGLGTCQDLRWVVLVFILQFVPTLQGRQDFTLPKTPPTKPLHQDNPPSTRPWDLYWLHCKLPLNLPGGLLREPQTRAHLRVSGGRRAPHTENQPQTGLNSLLPSL